MKDSLPSICRGESIAPKRNWKSAIILVAIVIVSASGMMFHEWDNDGELPFFHISGIVDKNGNGDYTSIQSAIDDATSGEIIRVWAGIYYENIVIDKQIELIGNGSSVTVIDGSYIDEVIKIRANYVKIAGLKVTKGSNVIGMNSFGAGISIGSEFYFPNYCTIIDCDISGNLGKGIFAFNDIFPTYGYHRITKNIISNNGDSGIIFYSIHYGTIENNAIYSNNGRGIYLDYGEHNTIRNNTLFSNADGIYIHDSNDNKIVNNTCYLQYFGIRLEAMNLYPCDNNIIKENNCSNNSYGIGSYAQGPNWIEDNFCSHNSHSGIYLDDSDGNTIWNNSCDLNQNGIYLLASKNNNIKMNSCSNNTAFGVTLQSKALYYLPPPADIWVYDHSSNNKVWNNTFFYNHGSTDTYDSSHIQAYDQFWDTNNLWYESGAPHGFGNYWSDWRIPDNDLNGIVDIPYDIAGDANKKDFYPLSEQPPPIPEPSIIVLISIMAIVFLFFIRRRPQ